MTSFVKGFRELAALFIDDVSLVLAILAVVGLAGIAAVLLPGAPMATGAILAFGNLGILLANVLGASKR
jgi:hypothetical protein